MGFRLVILGLLFLLLVLPVHAGTETLITTGTSGSDQTFPAISEDWIVWVHDDISGSRDIYAYNIETGTELRISEPESYSDRPAISGNVIVWENLSSSEDDHDIYAYNLSSGKYTRVTDDPDNLQQYPSISGNLVVWQDDRYDESDIYLFNLSNKAEQLLTEYPEGEDQEYPSISGNLVVWQDYRKGDSDIYLLDLSDGTEQLLAAGPAESWQEYPSISGNLVVWQDDRNGDSDIYLFNLSDGTETLVNDDGIDAAKELPSISGSSVVWIDGRNLEINDVYYRDLDSDPDSDDVRITEGRVILDPTIDGGPKIDGNHIVWTDSRNGNKDVYLYTLGADETCPVADFTLSTQTGATPLTVDFTNTSTPGTIGISNWVWDFGDGNSTSNEPNPRWIYNVSGTYTASLTVNNPLCRNMTPASAKYIVTTGGAAPVAAFTPSTTSGMVDLTVVFKDSSTGATAWNWSFGDGSYSETQSPSHTFTTAGTYTVILNASNEYGFSSAEAIIEALTGPNVNADTTISGIVVDDRFGGQFLVFDGSILAGYANPEPGFLISPPLPDDGWQNITFITTDPDGFHDFKNGTLMGNISTVILQTVEIQPAVFSPATGPLSSINYSVTLDTWPKNAVLNTQVWEGRTTADYEAFKTIAESAGYTYVRGVAYTTKITKTNFPAGGTARLFMSVNSSWITSLSDRDHTFVERISDDRGTGEVLRTRYLYTDTVKDLDYFAIDSPHGLSTFGLVQLSGSGNPLQLITLTVSGHVSPSTYSGSSSDSDSSSSDSGPAGGTGTTAGGPAPPGQLAPPEEPVDPGQTATVYTNQDAVVSQETELVSTDELASVSIPEGTVAKDAAGSPLGSVTITEVSSGTLPADTKGSLFSFEGMAYELGPDGATFSPAITLSFTVPNAAWGKEYTIRTYDRKSGTWQDLPTQYDPTTGKVTAQVNHFSFFGLFGQSIPAAPTQQAPPVHTKVPVMSVTPPPAPPSTAISIFSGMMMWAVNILLDHIVIFAGAGIIAGTLLLVYYRRSRKPFR